MISSVLLEGAANSIPSSSTEHLISLIFLLLVVEGDVLPSWP